MSLNNKEIVSIFKALSDENRIEILNLLKNEEQCACLLLEKLNLSQSGLSYHMKILTEAGLVIARPEGKWINYKIDNENTKELISILEGIFNK